jgi:hypothetical protein
MSSAEPAAAVCDFDTATHQNADALLAKLLSFLQVFRVASRMHLLTGQQGFDSSRRKEFFFSP